MLVFDVLPALSAGGPRGSESLSASSSAAPGLAALNGTDLSDLSDVGLQVGEIFTDCQGIMSGTPTRIASPPILRSHSSDAHG